MNLRDNVPEHTLGAIDNYVKHKYEPGSFLYSVLINDLKGAVSCADMMNQAALADIVKYLYNYVPATCWGSEDAVQRWLASR
jgi:hypothetical protein